MRRSRWMFLAALLAAAACHDKPGTVDSDGDGAIAASDCDDANPAVRQWVTAYADADGDGLGAGPPLSFCTDGLVPAGHSPYGTDCAPDDATAWRTIANPLVDGDGDGYAIPASATPCVGELLPAPYVAASRGRDCDDADASLYRWASLYADGDGDGVGAGPRTSTWACLGASVPAGSATRGSDADDTDPAVIVGPDEALVLSIVLD